MIETERADNRGSTVLLLSCAGALETWEYTLLEKYFQRVLQKIEAGREEYGMNYLGRTDESYRDQIEAELADLSGWAAMRFCKLRRGKP